jgi:hypothetical protein
LTHLRDGLCGHVYIFYRQRATQKKLAKHFFGYFRIKYRICRVSTNILPCSWHAKPKEIQRRPKGWAITGKACFDSTEEDGERGILLRDARGTSSTKVESFYDVELM